MRGFFCGLNLMAENVWNRSIYETGLNVFLDKGIGIFFGDNRFIKFGCEIFVNKLRVGRIRLLRILKSFNKN